MKVLSNIYVIKSHYDTLQVAVIELIEIGLFFLRNHSLLKSFSGLNQIFNFVLNYVRSYSLNCRRLSYMQY